MDPSMATAFARFLQDPNLLASLSQSASQSSPFPSHPVVQFPPPSFPPFCTQPPAPPVPPPSPPSTAKAKPSSSRSARRHRVTAPPEAAADDPKKKMYYSIEEDIRQASAWLENSIDPIEGVNRKGETYWTKVAEVYNQTTPPNRQRDPNCLKSHWHKCSRKVALFNGCYVQLRDAPVSGRNDEQLMEEALALYTSRSNGKHFKLMHWWKAVCDSPKWNVHAKSYDNGARKFTPDLNMNAPPTAQPRPMGAKRAKKAKGTTPDVAEAIVNVSQQLKTLVESNASQKEEVDAMKEYQQKLSNQRVEAANLTLLAAQEKHKCKLIDQKSKAMEMFTQLLQVDTSQMEDWAKNAHMRAVSNLSDQIWGKGVLHKIPKEDELVSAHQYFFCFMVDICKG